MAQRIRAAGMRPISLVVDVTNYVMLELGQPLHAYDGAKLTGPLGVRRAQGGETLETLDGTVRDLDPDDLAITDESGVIGLAGVMGGATTEISATTTHVVLEAAHFDPSSIARSARRHGLPSEASRRFERGVDPELAPRAAARAAQLLVDHGGAGVIGVSDVSLVSAPAPITVDAELPTRISGLALDRDTVVAHLRAVGCEVSGDGQLVVTPPSWRPDLTDPFDLVEEVVRLAGYDDVPSVLPQARPGRGLTPRQRLRRRLGTALAARGYVETPSYPFHSREVFDALDLPADDRRRQALVLANPLSDAEPLLRTSLLPGLLGALGRNVARGAADLALFETGLVFRPKPGAPAPPRLGVDRAPTPDELSAVAAALPDQPERVLPSSSRGTANPPAGGVPATRRRGPMPSRSRGTSRGSPASSSTCVPTSTRRGTPAGARRCTSRVGSSVTPASSIPASWPRSTCRNARVRWSSTSTYSCPNHPPCRGAAPVRLSGRHQDVAVVVDASVPAAEVEAALRDGAGELLESVRLFDVYRGAQVGAGRKSLAFALRFRAPDRTLTVDEVTAARDAAVAEAARRTGAVLRS